MYEVESDVGSARASRPTTRATLDAPTTTGDLAARARMIVDRMGDVSARLSQLGNRAYGEQPETDSKAKPTEGPPYGGSMAEIFYCLAQMDDRLTNIELAASRLDTIA